MPDATDYALGLDLDVPQPCHIHATMSVPCQTHPSDWCRYTGERPWAGMHPVQVMMKKAQGGAALAWPPGTPEPYSRLAQVWTDALDRRACLWLVGCK